MGDMVRTGEAGRRGPEVRSDCWVRVTLEEGHGLRVRVKSKVASMYGEAIRRLVEEGAEALGIRHAAVEVEDAGALPFVLAARLECAARRADPDLGGAFLLPVEPACTYGTERERLRRSRLYLPGDEPKFFLNAGLHGPDGVILDLEDSVAPEAKDGARVLVRNALRAVDFMGAERMVRINQLPAGLEDLEWTVPHNVHVVLVPKCEAAEPVQAVDRKVREIAGEGARDVFLMPIIESALGVVRAFEIASASPRVVALAVGLEDYTADIGAQRTKEGRESFYARCAVVNAARAAGVAPIDTVFSDVADMEGLRASVAEAKALGFEGKGCIHPRQIRVVHEAFAPAPEELDRARRIMEAYERARAEGKGVVALGRKMIDPPVVKRALRTVRLAGSRAEGRAPGGPGGDGRGEEKEAS